MARTAGWRISTKAWPRPRLAGHRPRARRPGGAGIGVRRAERRFPHRHVRGGRRRRAQPRHQVRPQAPHRRPRVPQEHTHQLHHRPQADEQSRRVRVRGPSAGEVVPHDRGRQQQRHCRAGHEPEGGRDHRRARFRAGRRGRGLGRRGVGEPPSAGDGREVQRGDLQHGEAAGGGDRRAAGPRWADVQGQQAGIQLQDEGGDGGEARAVHAGGGRAARHRLRRSHGAVLRLRLQEVSK